MITDEIKELLRADPFKPIRIVLTDLQSFTVAHTDYLMVSPDRQTILLYDEKRRTVVLTRQFRYPAFVNGYDDLLVEAPAGLLDNASPEDRIRAEVEEETGYRVRNVRQVFEAFMSDGIYYSYPSCLLCLLIKQDFGYH